MREFKYISNISTEDIKSNNVIPCIDEEGNHCILIKNSVMKKVETKFSTDNLKVQLDSVLHLDGEEFYFHIITAVKNYLYSSNQFEVIYDYIFKKIDEPISGMEMNVLITSIEDYFRTTPEKDLFSLQVGVYGELFAIKYLYELGYKEIIDKYHNNFYSKHDFEINKKIRIEIKSTNSEKRIHTFKHNQIFRSDIEVFVVSVMLEQSEEDMSLFDLFEEIKNLYSDPDSILGLDKLMKRCNVSEEKRGLSFSAMKAYNDIRIFDAKSLPKINMETPDGVTNIKYDVDCSLGNSINVESFIKYIRCNA